MRTSSDATPQAPCGGATLATEEFGLVLAGWRIPVQMSQGMGAAPAQAMAMLYNVTLPPRAQQRRHMRSTADDSHQEDRQRRLPARVVDSIQYGDEGRAPARASAATEA